MTALPPGLHSGIRVHLSLANGGAIDGLLEHVQHGWLRVRGDDGVHYVQLTHIACIGLGAEEAASIADTTDAALPVPKAHQTRGNSKAPGRPWADDDLRRLADAFLDQQTDQDLATRHNRTRAAIRELRQGFECARGNLVEDQITPVATTWVPRWRRVLGG